MDEELRQAILDIVAELDDLADRLWDRGPPWEWPEESTRNELAHEIAVFREILKRITSV